MYCKNCGSELTPSAEICLKCGVKVGKGNTFCEKCGAKPDPLASICVACGHVLKNEDNKNSSNNGPVDSFGGAIKTCFNKYADFEGRANRSEYWYWFLFNVLLGILSLAPLVAGIISLILFIPSLAVSVRRLHDIGKSGWWYLIGLIPLIGTIILIIFFLQESMEEDNEYGPNPNY